MTAQPMGIPLRRFAACVLLAAVPWAWGLGGEAGGAKAPTLLETGSQWRAHFAWQEELVEWESGEVTRVKMVRGGAKPIEKVEGKAGPSAPPPADWTSPAFDDGSWAASPGPLVHAPHRRDLAAMCLRGKFVVAQPGEATLSVAYRGGAIVYLNGKELARAHLPAGPVAMDALAESYGRGAYVDAAGVLLDLGPKGPVPDGMKLRVRTLTQRVPASAFREGLNVLAVELHRAPTSELLYTAPAANSRRRPDWSMVGLEELSLAGPGAAPAPSLQAWPGNPLVDAWDLDPAEAGMAGKPVVLAGARNGAFSGVVMLRSTEAIASVKVEPGELKRVDGEGTLPASAWRIRYARPGDPPPRDAQGRHPAGSTYLGALLEGPPAEIAVPAGASGVVLPVWATVRVARDAKPGDYKGTLKLSVNAAAPVEVPVELTVADVVLPDPTSYTCFTGIGESPESLALQYGVPLWSEAHWKLLDRAFGCLGQVGTKMVLIPLIARTNRGNDQSMMRWIRQPDGSWKHDFGVVERYLDLVVKHLGKVPVVCWYVWTPLHGGGAWGKTPDTPKNAQPMVFTAVDPATGEAHDAEGPDWGTPASVAFWRPVFAGLKERLAKRGLERAAALGLVCDFTPSKQTVDDLAAVAPDLKWVVHAHGKTLKFADRDVAEAAHVWGIHGPFLSTHERSRRGWQNPIPLTVFPRYGAGSMGHVHSASPVAIYHALLEGYQTSGYDGVNDLGADFWPVVKGPRGKMATLTTRYSHRDRPGPPTMTHGELLFPAKDGPVATVRFEALRLGNQETEARILIERALADPQKRARLGDDLAGRAQRLLDERVARILHAKLDYNPMFSMGTDASWLDYAAGATGRARALFAAAAEVARNLAD